MVIDIGIGIGIGIGRDVARRVSTWERTWERTWKHIIMHEINTNKNQNNMATDKFQNKYRILSARAKWHDYGGGMYFITICTKHKIHFFGNVCNGEMKFTPIGAYLNEQIKSANQHYPYCEIPLFVVMPNHWHAIVIVDGDKIPYQRRQCGGNGGNYTQ